KSFGRSISAVSTLEPPRRRALRTHRTHRHKLPWFEVRYERTGTPRSRPKPRRVTHTERRTNSVRPPRFCGVAGHRTQTTPRGADRVVGRRWNSSIDAAWCSAAEVGA